MPPWPSKNFLEKPCDSHEEPCRWGRYIVGHGSNQAISELMSEQILSKQDGDLLCLMHDECHIDDRIILKFYSIICHGFISVFIAFSKAGSSFFSHKVIGSGQATLCLKDAATFLALSCKGKFQIEFKDLWQWLCDPRGKCEHVRLQPPAICNVQQSFFASLWIVISPNIF